MPIIELISLRQYHQKYANFIKRQLKIGQVIVIICYS